MTIRGRVAAIILAGLLEIGAAARPPAQPSVDLVELSVVVTAGNGQPVTDLTRNDFEVREDGRKVELRTFLAASASGSLEVDDGRSVVVVLDDVGVAAPATDSVRSVARYLVALAGPGDEVSIVRLSNASDEPYGDTQLAYERIAGYRAGIARFDAVRSREAMLQLVAAASTRLEANGRRRKAIVCIGSPAICNIGEPTAMAAGSLRSDWVSAIGATARADVSVYALMGSRGRFPGGGLTVATGGEAFASRGDLAPFIDRIWRDLSRHYLLGYWPSGSTKPLRAIDVKVNRRGVQVRARRLRGS